MRYPFEHIRVKHREDIPFIEEDFRKRRRGEILHLTLSFIKTKEEVKKLPFYVRKAIFLSGEKPISWNLKEDFVKPLEKLFALSEINLFFPAPSENVKILRERSFLSGIKAFRPDRVILYPEFVVVVDFKTHYPSEKEEETLEIYQNQVCDYMKIVSQVFKLPAQGYLLFIGPPKVEKIGEVKIK